MTTVHIPALLKHLTGNVDRIEVELPAGERRTVRDVLSLLQQRFPGVGAGLLLDGELSPSVAVFIGDEQALLGLDAKVSADDILRFIPPIVGG